MANIERLRELRRVIEAVPEDRLHMRRFSEKTTCGTAYCAAGWAAVDPWFREHTEIGKILICDRTGYVQVAEESEETFGELARLFGISDDEAEDLFAGGITPCGDPHVVSKEEVIANIDALIAGEETQPYEAVRFGD